MKVRELMREVPRYTTAGESLASAGRTMAEAGVGVLPVVDQEHRVVAVLTDRDICCVLAKANRRPSELRVEEAASSPPWVCEPGDDLETALGTMRLHGIRRLPVVDALDRLEGLLSLDEVVLAAKARTHGAGEESMNAALLATMKAIVRPQAALIEVTTAG